MAVNLGGGAAVTFGGRVGFALGGGEALSAVLSDSRLRDGNGGAGLDPVPALPLAGTTSSLSVGVDGPLLLSSVLAPGIFPTLFGGGANVLTSLTAIVAKCRDPTSLSSSFLPLKGTIISLCRLKLLPFDFAPSSLPLELEANSFALLLKAFNRSMVLR